MAITVIPATSGHEAELQAAIDAVRAERDRLRADREVLLGFTNYAWQTLDRHMGEVDAAVLRNMTVRLRNAADGTIARVQG